MTWLLLALAVVLAAGLGFGWALLSDSRKQQRDYRQVVPGVGPEAPAAWVGGHTPEAKLHRRIRDAVKSAHAQPGVVHTHLAGLDTAAIALDERLIGAAALPPAYRAAAVAEFEPLVARLEQSVASLVGSPAALGEAFEESMATVRAELDALAEARAEVERIDRQAPPPAPDA